jgi:hypothetical protein
MVTHSRFGVSGTLTSEDGYSTYRLSLYDFWYVYHPKEWAATLAAHGVAPVVRQRKRPLVLAHNQDGDISAILCRNGWVLADSATGRQTKNLTMRGFGDDRVFPAVESRSKEADRFCQDHGYTAPYRARTWCPTHRTLHGHINYTSPQFGPECFYSRHPEYLPSQFRSIPYSTFICAECGKHRPTVQKERQHVWKLVHDTLMANRKDSWDSIGAIWDKARESERAHTCCQSSIHAEVAA